MPSELSCWGDFPMEIGCAGRWRIGPLTLWIERLDSEWRIAHENGSDPWERTTEVHLPVEAPDLLSFEKMTRFGAEDPTDSIQISPQLADRPVNTRPEKPFHIPPGDEVTIFVTSPLWVRVSLGQGNMTKMLEELPVVRPSDTWFGPTTEGGQLCYAVSTFCRIRFSEIILLPHRAVTAVRLINPADTPLVLDRLNLPVPHLALYRTTDGVFWTQDATFERHEKDEFARLEITPGAPVIDKDSRLIATPRAPEPNAIIRAFNSLLSS